MRTRDAQLRELLDTQAFEPVALQRNLRDIRRINALLGWTTFTVRQLSRYVRSRQLRRFSLLDVASGSADMPLAIARWARRNGIAAHIVATDVNPAIVAVAREQAASLREVQVEVQDALALTYPAGSFDVALCTLALHHFDPEPAVTLLRNLAHAGRRVMVFDVVRSPAAYAGAVLLTRAARMDGMTRHDAPASVRRAYTVPELETLAARAGLRDAHVRVGFPFRLALDAPGDT